MTLLMQEAVGGSFLLLHYPAPPDPHCCDVTGRRGLSTCLRRQDALSRRVATLMCCTGPLLGEWLGVVAQAGYDDRVSTFEARHLVSCFSQA
ncbi:putative Mannose-P-dolichol utilization defect 1 protein like protein [Fusarium oxysporum f. sp. albedinis]|nr:putative Mannose-P-dolichol utilization defect 1 protein like protein [Fusarium oxysporum f. sp. albedinis]